ncbi:MAG: hypothetical protein JOZ99_15010, partial [Actinobacteria bacterium]|nr:hypothetical protein [Actinomycetota bacterium]
MDVAALSDDAIDAAVDDLHAELNGALVRLLRIVGEHDRRRLWRSSASASEAAHLVGVLAVSWRTANDWVRLAHALERHPSW